MSRSGLHEDDGDDPLQFGRWRGATMAAIRGKRGQAALREIAAAMDSMDCKSLTSGALAADGEFCTIGLLMSKRGIDTSEFDVCDYDAIAEAIGVNAKIVQEIEWFNDDTIHDWHYVEHCGPPAPKWNRWDPTWTVEVREANPDANPLRWVRMRDWVAGHIKEEVAA